jgi:serine/threonine protein kinase
MPRLPDAGLTDDHQRFRVPELVCGQGLVSHTRAARRPLPAVLGLFRELLSAVAWVHAQLVIHRDIKPTNVVVAPGGDVELLDSGIARLGLDADGRHLRNVRSALCTRPDAGCGRASGRGQGSPRRAHDAFSSPLTQRLPPARRFMAATSRQVSEPTAGGGTGREAQR